MSREPHSTPIGDYPSWRREEISRKYNGPDEWTPDLDGDGEIDDVDLEGSHEESL